MIKKRQSALTSLSVEEKTKIKEIAQRTLFSQIELEVFYQVNDVELSELENVMNYRLSKGV